MTGRVPPAARTRAALHTRLPLVPGGVGRLPQERGAARVLGAAWVGAGRGVRVPCGARRARGAPCIERTAPSPACGRVPAGKLGRVALLPAAFRPRSYVLSGTRARRAVTRRLALRLWRGAGAACSRAGKAHRAFSWSACISSASGGGQRMNMATAAVACRAATPRRGCSALRLRARAEGAARVLGVLRGVEG